MTVPVDFLLQAERDLIEFVPLDKHTQLLEDLIDRLGRYPEIGVRLEPPEDFARAHRFADWVAYWEPIYTAVDEVERVEVIRIVPDAFSRIVLFP